MVGFFGGTIVGLVTATAASWYISHLDGGRELLLCYEVRVHTSIFISHLNKSSDNIPLTPHEELGWCPAILAKKPPSFAPQDCIQG
jgi:hypothetical protein